MTKIDDVQIGILVVFNDIWIFLKQIQKGLGVLTVNTSYPGFRFKICYRHGKIHLHFSNKNPIQSLETIGKPQIQQTHQSS